MPHGVQPPSSNCAEPLEPFLSVQTPEKRSFFFFFSVLVSGKTQPGEAHSAKVRPKPPGVIQPETPKQSGGRSPFRMNPTQNSATCYSDSYDKELRSTGSYSKVPVNAQRLECSRSRRSALVLPDLLVSETSLFAGIFDRTGHALPTSSALHLIFALADACTGFGALSAPAGAQLPAGSQPQMRSPCVGLYQPASAAAV